jgi:hypothetical protein
MNDTEEKFKALTPACYGCTFSCASPTLSCDHPLTIRLSYDGFTTEGCAISMNLVQKEERSIHL